MGSNKFFDKAFNDKVLVDNLLKFKSVIWRDLSNDEKIKVCRNIASRINTFYPELGQCKFDFIVSNKRDMGNSFDDYVAINLDIGREKNNQFFVLSTLLHELRHYYQNMAQALYDKEGIIHEMFEKEDFKKIYENNDNSKLCSASNYINCEYNNFYEYYIQPLEYDAEKFAKEFLEIMIDKLLVNAIDIELCLNSFSEFEEISDIIEGNSRNIINFNKVYEYNYKDYILNNKRTFIRDELKAAKYQKLLDNIEKVNNEQIYILFIPGLWDKYSNEDKLKIINRYLEINNFELNVEVEDYKYVVNDKKFVAFNSFEILEVIFKELADIEIKRMLEKKDNGHLMRIEKEIRLNMKNPIKEEENPLFYNVQPYMLYKNNYIMRLFYDAFRSIDAAYGTDFNYFSDYSKLVKKYDVESMVKKVEILTGESFDEFYDKMLLKMKERKTR